jgi:hypothetical protein
VFSAKHQLVRLQWVAVSQHPEQLANFVVELLFGTGNKAGMLMPVQVLSREKEAAALLHASVLHATACLDMVHHSPLSIPCSEEYRVTLHMCFVCEPACKPAINFIILKHGPPPA